MKNKHSANNGRHPGAEHSSVNPTNKSPAPTSDGHIPAEQPAPESNPGEPHEKTEAGCSSTQPTQKVAGHQSPRPGRIDRGLKPSKSKSFIFRRSPPSLAEEDAEQDLATGNKIAAVDEVIEAESAGDVQCDVQVVGLSKLNLFTSDPTKARAQVDKKALSNCDKRAIFCDDQGEHFSLFFYDERGDRVWIMQHPEGEGDQPSKLDSGGEFWGARRTARIAEIGQAAYDEERGRINKEYLEAGEKEDIENKATAEAKAKVEAEARAEAARRNTVASPSLPRPKTREQTLAQEERETHAMLEEIAKQAGGTPEEQARRFAKLKEIDEHYDRVSKLLYFAHGATSKATQLEATREIQKLSAMVARYGYPWIRDLVDYFDDELKPSWKSARRSQTHQAQGDVERSILPCAW